MEPNAMVAENRICFTQSTIEIIRQGFRSPHFKQPCIISIGYTRPKLLRLIFRMPTNSQLCKTPCIYSEIIT